MTKEQKNEINNIKKKFSDYREINKLNKLNKPLIKDILSDGGFKKWIEFHISKNHVKIAELEAIIEVLINE